MKKLIVNADDLGADEGRNAGILEAVLAGTVKSVSLLANGPATGLAIREIRRGKFAGVSIGVHLNLSEGTPLCPDLRLLAEGGSFRGKTAAQRLLLRENLPELENEIAREVNAQVEALVREKIPLSHLDGHQHLHVFPAVRRAAFEAAGKFRIPWVRIPDEPFPVWEEGEIPAELKAEAESFSERGREAARYLPGADLRAPDHFRGLYLKGRMGPRVLGQYVERLVDGVTELMVHPGRVLPQGSGGPFSGFSTLEREKELSALRSPSFREALLRQEVSLISFREALS
jgi:predicted glycoside hydrolase/deacetylase ChbG (UPF0249 family)